MSKKKINILFLIDTYKDGGGTETHLAYLTKHLDKNKFNCIICAFDLEECPFVQEIREGGITIKHIPVCRIYGVEALMQSFNLMRFIKDNDIDIVQTFHFKSDTYGVLVATCAGVPKIISSRRDLGDLKRPRQIFLNKLINPLIDHFIMVCKSVEKAVKESEKISEGKISVIYNGVDLKKFTPSDPSVGEVLRKELGFKKEDFVIGSVAYFREEKAHHIFFEALQLVSSNIKGWKALILGCGPLEKRFKMLCKEKKLDEHVKFMGSVKDVQKYIQVMDLICLVPNKNEGFSNTILEGMALAKPIIGTNVGGNAEAILDRETGIIISPNDSERLAQAIFKLYANPALRKRMGQNGRKRVEENFSLDDMIYQLEQLYLKIYQEVGR